MKNRKKWGAIVVVAGMLCAAAAHAVRYEETEIVYFNEFGEVVGGYVLPCEGPVDRWGVQTIYTQVYTQKCSPNWHPTPPQPLP